MADRQNRALDTIVTVKSSTRIDQVLHKEKLQEQSDALTAALTLNPQDTVWTAALRTAMTNARDDLDDIIALI